MKGRRALAMLAGTAAMVMALPVQASAMEEAQAEELSVQAGEEFGICPEFLQAVAWVESRYGEDAESGGCSGLMQVSERWHRERMDRLGVSDLYDPAGNMRVAADYMAELFERYGDPGMVLMVYNGDSGAARYQDTGEGLSDYAAAVLEMAAELERRHGK